MFVGFSKTLARFGGIRLSIGARMSKKTAPYLIIFVLFYYMFYYILALTWYILIASLWLTYAIIYGLVWILKKAFKLSIPFIDELMKKYAEKCNEKQKEGNQA